MILCHKRINPHQTINQESNWHSEDQFTIDVVNRLHRVVRI